MDCFEGKFGNPKKGKKEIEQTKENGWHVIVSLYYCWK